MTFAEYITDHLLYILAMVFELLGLLIILFISSHVSKKVKLFMRIVVGLLFFSITVTILEMWTQDFETLSIWRPILTSLKYCIYPVVMFVLIIFLAESMKPLKKMWYWIMAIPQVAVAPLYFTSQWSHLVFFYSQENSWAGGPLRYLPYIIFGLYLALFVALNIIYLRYYSFKNRFVALYISLASTACIVPCVIIGETNDFNPILVAALVFYFLFIYIHMANIDPLTGLLNRQSYYQDMEEKRRMINFVISIDMNDLKLINDTQGHAAGDEALLTISNIIKNNTSNKTSCYRIGGDEFMILAINTTEEQVKKEIQKMREELDKTPYRCAFGYAMRETGSSTDSAAKEADKKMYLDKASMKKKQK